MSKVYRFRVYRSDETLDVYLMSNKSDGTWSFVNMTKGHICPCRFGTVSDAVKDIDSYVDDGRIVMYELFNSDKECAYE